MLRLLSGGTDDVTRPPSTRAPCHVLQLPIELILLVADQLAPHCRAILAETCRQLRAVLLRHHGRLQPLPHLSLNQHMKYLACRARDPEWYACKACKTLHRVTDETLERALLPRACTRGRDSSFYWSRYGLDYHHVQLALKYTRLNGPDRRYQSQLDRLLAPRCESHDSCLSHHVSHRRHVPSFRSRFESRHSVVERRYHLFSICEFRRPQPHVPLSSHIIDHIQVCPHLTNRKWRFAAAEAPQEPAYARPRHALAVALRRALDGQGDVNLHGSCRYCTTDFAVRASLDRLVLRCWHDLGSEHVRSAELWSAIVNQAPSLQGQHIAHVPGSVRARFVDQNGMEEDMMGDWLSPCTSRYGLVHLSPPLPDPPSTWAPCTRTSRNDICKH